MDYERKTRRFKNEVPPHVARRLPWWFLAPTLTLGLIISPADAVESKLSDVLSADHPANKPGAGVRLMRRDERAEDDEAIVRAASVSQVESLKMLLGADVIGLSAPGSRHDASRRVPPAVAAAADGGHLPGSDSAPPEDDDMSEPSQATPSNQSSDDYVNGSYGAAPSGETTYVVELAFMIEGLDFQKLDNSQKDDMEITIARRPAQAADVSKEEVVRVRLSSGGAEDGVKVSSFIRVPSNELPTSLQRSLTGAPGQEAAAWIAEEMQNLPGFELAQTSAGSVRVTPFVATIHELLDSDIPPAPTPHHRTRWKRPPSSRPQEQAPSVRKIDDADAKYDTVESKTDYSWPSWAYRPSWPSWPTWVSLPSRKSLAPAMAVIFAVPLGLGCATLWLGRWWMPPIAFSGPRRSSVLTPPCLPSEGSQRSSSASTTEDAMW